MKKYHVHDRKKGLADMSVNPFILAKCSLKSVNENSMSEDEKMKKKVSCPVCGARLMDEAEHTKSEVRIIESDDDWEPDYFNKCRQCKNEIGIKQLK